MENLNKVQAEKQQLRQLIREKKKQYDTHWKERISEEILSRLEQNPLFQEASCLLFYHALPDEVQTARFLEKWHPRKQFILPVVENDYLLLRSYEPEKLQAGGFGIMEPTGELFEESGKIDLVIIPGMGFDRAGNRLGRGKGYYDRLLPKIGAPKIGLAFAWQIFDRIPTEPFDCVLDGILTEQEFIYHLKAF
ncbi:MAG: 5-formyltetrahydrofolate cyclo-ligase [Bacteroidales bacterium]